MKINCPYHEDHTASMELYDDGKAHCFGCGITVGVEEAHNKAGIQFTTDYYQTRSPTPKEDINASIQAIRKMEVINIRGLSLPTDGDSYYVVWPDSTYYNRRFFEATDARAKYKCPSGHAKRLFVASTTGKYGPLAVVEGEINALSVAKACPHLDVVSPGGAGDFYSKSSEAYYDYYQRFHSIYLFADEDKAGAIACINLKSKLVQKKKTVYINLMKTDANDILVKDGPYALKQEIEKRMGLPGRM